MVDGHLATATTRGDNYHLDLDGILHLGKDNKESLKRILIKSLLKRLLWHEILQKSDPQRPQFLNEIFLKPLINARSKQEPTSGLLLT